MSLKARKLIYEDDQYFHKFSKQLELQITGLSKTFDKMTSEDIDRAV